MSQRVLENNLQSLQERFNYFSNRNRERPNRVFQKWAEIYEERLNQAKERLQKHTEASQQGN